MSDYRDGLLRLKALALGARERGDYTVYWSYVLEKIDTALAGLPIPLDRGNTAIYEDLKKRVRQ